MATTQEWYEQYWTSHGGSTPQSSSCMITDHPSQKLSKLVKHAGHCWRSKNKQVMYSCGPLHMDEQRQNDQVQPTYSSSVPIRDLALKTCRKRWMIERVGKRGSGISVLMVQWWWWWWWFRIWIYLNLYRSRDPNRDLSTVNLLHPSALWTGFRIWWLYPLQRGKTPSPQNRWWYFG